MSNRQIAVKLIKTVEQLKYNHNSLLCRKKSSLLIRRNIRNLCVELVAVNDPFNAVISPSFLHTDEGVACSVLLC